MCDREAMLPFLLLASETETETERESVWWAINQVRHRGRGGGRLEVAFAWLDQGRKQKGRICHLVVSLKFVGSPLARVVLGRCLIVFLFEVSFSMIVSLELGQHLTTTTEGACCIHPWCVMETMGSCRLLSRPEASCRLRSQPEAWARATIPSNSWAAHCYHMISQLNLT
jgi:hypothetical protein